MLWRFIHLSLWGSGLGLWLLGYAVLVEPALLFTRHVDFVSDKYEGPELRIGLVTDIHINSPPVPPKRVKRLVEALNAVSPDIVLIPGDFIAGHDKKENRSDNFNRNIKEGIEYLSILKAPIYATIGNHDAWWSASSVRTLLEQAGVTVLENEAIPLAHVCLVGLADYETSQPDRRAYSGCPPHLRPLVFTHSPDAWRDFRSDTVLAFAGHTHGGQINLPIIGRRVNATTLGPEHSYGFSKLGGVDVFVSAGVGTSILPIRFRAPPEIVVITLRGGE